MHIKAIHLNRITAAVVVLTGLVTLFGLHTFYWHDEGFYAHGFDLSATALVERIFALLRISEAAVE